MRPSIQRAAPPKYIEKEMVKIRREKKRKEKKEKKLAKKHPKHKVRVLPKEVPHLAPWRPYQERFLLDPSPRKLWVKSAQIGGSTALADWSLGRCLERDKHLVVILSASERQAKEVSLKMAELIQALSGVTFQRTQGFFEDTDVLVHTIEFPNGSRTIALPAKPSTARGYTGDIVLDEFGHVADDEEIFKVAYRQITLGYQMLVISTPNGQQGRFWKMAKELGLDTGRAPFYQPVKKGTWSGHWTDIYLAVSEGLPVDPEEIRSGCDEMTWQQEYCCAFLSETMMWLSPSLVEACVDRAAMVGPPQMFRSNLFCGWDVARSHDRSVLWFTELNGDVSWTRGVINISGMDTPTQIQQARTWMPQIARMNVDMSGMGLTIYELLKEEFPTRVDGVQFTAATKEQMAVYLRTRMEQRKLRLPNDETVRRSFLSLRRSTNRVGQMRFDAEHDSQYGHADELWACALAEMAAERQANSSQRSGEPSNIMYDSRSKGPLSNFMVKPL